MRQRVLSAVLILALLIAPVFTSCSRQAGGKGKDKSSSKSKSELLDCDWVLKVDQTIPVTTDGLTVEYTLVLIAEKKGGTDVLGTYEGAAYIGCKLDMSNLSNEVMEFTGGFDLNAFGNNISFDIVSYDIEEYSNYGLKKGELGLAPLVEYEAMALISPEMTGGGVINPNIEGRPEGSISGGINESAYSTAPIPMKITVKSGKVDVSLPTLKIGNSFKGQLLGVPTGDSEEYDKGLAKLEKLKKEAEEKDDPPSGEGGSTGLGGLGGIMGQIGTNLTVPDSFPSDNVPIMSNVNVINVYENEDKKNVRIMFGTDKDYDEVLEYYQDNFISKLESEPTPIDIDGGVMYMCDAEGYRNITVMIMEDPSETYETTVMLEVSKK